MKRIDAHALVCEFIPKRKGSVGSVRSPFETHVYHFRSLWGYACCASPSKSQFIPVFVRWSYRHLIATGRLTALSEARSLNPRPLLRLRLIATSMLSPSTPHLCGLRLNGQIPPSPASSFPHFCPRNDPPSPSKTPLHQIEAWTLRSLIKEEKDNPSYSATELFRLSLRMADGLQAIHDQHVVLSDIKTDNILLQVQLTMCRASLFLIIASFHPFSLRLVPVVRSFKSILSV